MKQLQFALAGSIDDQHHLIHGGAGSKDFSLSLDRLAELINARLPAGIALTVDQVAEDAQTLINELDATDLKPGDGLLEEGFDKHIPVKGTLFRFIRIEDDVEAQAGIVVGVKDVAAAPTE